MTVTIGGQKKTAAPDASGKWMVRLDEMEAVSEPQEMTVTDGTSSKVFYRYARKLRSHVGVAGKTTRLEVRYADEHQRTINKPGHALLLEMAQAIDETANPTGAGTEEEAAHHKTVSNLSTLTREGAEWVVSVTSSGAAQGWGTQSAQEALGWIRSAAECCRRLSERLEAGPLSHIDGVALDRRLVLLPTEEKAFLVAWPLSLDTQRALERTKHLIGTWDS